MNYIIIEELKFIKGNNKIIYIVKDKLYKQKKYQISSASQMGKIEYDPVRKQYCFFPSIAKIFPYEYLKEIANFIMNLNKMSDAGKNGAKAGKFLKNKITFDPNGSPLIFIKE